MVGTGYVGLSTAVGLAELGHSVVGADIDERKVSSLRAGVSPIDEAGMNDALGRCADTGRLTFTTDVVGSCADANIVFLCLPTPQGPDGAADLSYIRSAVEQIKEVVPTGTVVVNKSTVPTGTSRRVVEWFGRSDVHVVSNPEFLRQGSALHDFLHPDRIVIGGNDDRAVETIASLYAQVDAPVLRMSAASAEALKYAANSFLATKLTFVNAVADICELVGADITDVVRGLSLDPRVGHQFLNPGPGWGGSCFPKDTRALVKIAEEHGYDFALLRGVIQTNDEQYERIAMKVVELCGGSVEGKTIAAWGLTFKAHTDDLRDSPAIAILSILHGNGARIRAHEPTSKGPYQSYPWITVSPDPLSACAGADALVVLTEWPMYSTIRPDEVSSLLKAKCVVDGRNVLDIDAWKSEGFEYRGVGRN